MRILVAAERLGQSGGMERYLDIVLPALAARGADVRVLARACDRVPREVAAETVPWSDEHDAPDAAARAHVEAVVRAFAPDVAVAHNVMDAGIVEALRAAPRLAYHVHDHRPFCPNGDRVYPRSGRNCTVLLGAACALHALTEGCAYGPRPRTLTLIRRRERLRDAIARADTVVVASRYVAERAVGSGIARGRIAEIPLPLPDDAYANAPAPPTARAVLFAGRVVPQKGLDTLVRALATLDAERRPELRVCGGGPALPAARRAAERLGVALTAYGSVDAAAVRAAMDDAAVVALPSRWAEPFGYVGIEAFARGRPVVAFAVGGVDAWLADGRNGIAVPAGDGCAFGAAIARLIAASPAYGAAARADAERFRCERVIDALLAAYRPA